MIDTIGDAVTFIGYMQTQTPQLRSAQTSQTNALEIASRGPNARASFLLSSVAALQFHMRLRHNFRVVCSAVRL